jgi:hypothetical protein
LSNATLQDLFVKDWPNGVSEETQRIVEEAQGIPCEGGGVTFPECESCPWCGGLEWIDYESADDFEFS